MGKRWKTSGNIETLNLVTTEEKYLKTVMKPNLKSGVLFCENLMGCEMGKIKVVMNKPVYFGQAILDLRKIVMYEFHYDYMKRMYDSDKICGPPGGAPLTLLHGHRFISLPHKN